MLTILDSQGNEIPMNGLKRVERNKEVSGAFTLAFTSFFHKDNSFSHANNPAHKLVKEEAVVRSDGYDFRIKQVKETKNYKEVVAVSTFFDMSGKWKHDLYGGTRSFVDFLAFIFIDTGWIFTHEGNFESAFIPNFGNDNVVKLVEVICSVYECDFEIRPNKVIHFAKEIGPDNDYQYRYDHNIKALSKNVDTSNLRTRIKGYGAEGVEVEYISPNEGKFIRYEKEPINDQEYSAELMAERLVRELTDEPEITLEMDVIELTERPLGERIWLIYEPLDVKIKTRILSKKSTLVNGKWATKSIEIGNTKKKTLTDLLASTNIKIDENARQTRSRIEQTNQNITLAVEQFAGEVLKAYSKFELTAGEIRAEVAEIEEGLSSSLSLTAEAIRAEVKESSEASVEYINEQKKLIEAKIAEETGRLEGELNSVDGVIKVVIDDLGTLNAELDTLTGEITSIKTEASSNFDILSNAIVATVKESKEYANAVGESVRSEASSNFTVLAGRINSKAEASTVSSLGTRVNTVESNMDAVSGEISQKVSSSDYNGNTVVSMINQTASNITIDAAKITLRGAVTVLSDISGDLGNITAGNINISQKINVGNGVHMRGSQGTGIYFDSWSQIFDSGGSMQIEAPFNLDLVANVLDLTGIKGISWGVNRPTAVWG